MAIHGLWTGESYYLADSRTDDSWWLDGSYTAPPNLTLRDATIGSVNTDNFWSGTLSTWGPSTITDGIHVGGYSGFQINLQRVGSLELDGSSSVGYHTRFEVNGGGPYQQLVLNGTLELNAASSVIRPDVVGNGNIVVVGRATDFTGNLELGGAVGSGETIWCLQGGLKVDQPLLMHGTLEGLGDGVSLEGINGVVNPVLTATDLTFSSFVDGSSTSSFVDLHIKDTPYHEVAVRSYGGPSGSITLTSNPSSVGAIPQTVIHQTA